MLAIASKPFIAQTHAWMAVAMLLVQILPAASCVCGDCNSPRCFEVAQSQTGAMASASCCCGSSGACITCSGKKPSSCCRTIRTDSSSNTRDSCRCGIACQCAKSPTRTDPATPVPRDDHRQVLPEVTAIPSPSALGISAGCLSELRGVGFDRPVTTTALIRCIELSRFRC